MMVTEASPTAKSVWAPHKPTHQDLPMHRHSWDTIQHVFYRKEELYTMAWAVHDLSDYVAATAQLGGLIGDGLCSQIHHTC